MKPLSFRLRAWRSWTPDQEARDHKPVPAFLRRRVTPIGRQALSAAYALEPTANARYVLSSRHGEFSRTLSLLEAVVKRTELSPADFTLSVHHALLGLLSITCGNHHGHIAVAAGQESFCFGLVESIAYLKENPNEPVILIHYDEPLAAPFTEIDQFKEQPIVLALELAASGEGTPLQLQMESSSPKRVSASHAFDFLNFLQSDTTEAVSPSEQRQWRWTKNALD